MKRLFDISRTLGPATSVWPGDTPFQPFWVMRMDRGDSCNVGSVTMSLHAGTHADAPLHFLPGGAAIGDLDLTSYIGAADVVLVRGAGIILPEHLARLDVETAERVLFRTDSALETRFATDFAHFSLDAAEALVAMGTRLVGIDTPSVDVCDSRTLGAHKVFAAAGVVILENLRLGDVAPGRYELIALPLKLAGMDASPVRAVLRTL